MAEQTPFASRIRERYPEGLTGVLAVGGTRTTYILEHNRQDNDPGHIPDFSAYADFLLGRYLHLTAMFFDLGGQNLVMPVLSYQSFYERGEEYAELVARLCLGLINQQSLAHYRDNAIDPYFTGVDTLLHLPESHPAHRLGAELTAFQQRWPYQDGRRKLIWEIASIPLYSFWKAQSTLSREAQTALEAALVAATDLNALYHVLYRFYARAVFGTEIPVPHFYLGTNRNGDLKLRSPMPIALTCGGSFRLFYTPYPTLYVTRETLQAILEDLAFGKRLRSEKTDYSGQYTSELAEAEYQRLLTLSTDPASTLGLARQVPAPADS